MKITKSYLKQLIKEEIEKISEEERKAVKIGDVTYQIVVDGGDLLSASGPTGLISDKAELLKIKQALRLK